MIIPRSTFRIAPAQLAGFCVALVFHALIITILITYAPTRDALKAIAPLMVQLIKPEMPAPAVAKPEPKVDRLPKPLPIRKAQPRPESQSPLLAAQTPDANPPAVVMPPETRPLPPVEARVAPPTAPVVAPAPTPIVPPSFNADYLDNPAPAYPPLARRMGEVGRVLLRVHVEASGLPSTVEIRTSSGSERLDHAALEAVKRWKFVPARQGDKAVAAYVVVPISFNLKG